MEIVNKAQDAFKSFRENRLSGLKPVGDFFNHRQLSLPQGMNEATQRLTYNARNFSGNYVLVILVLSLYALLTNPLLLIAIGLFAGGFTLINRFVTEDIHIGSLVITQKTLYIGLFALGLPILFFASPVSVFFWLVASSAILVLGHAILMEPGVESEYQGVESV